MARIIGGVDPATDHNFSSVWNLNSDIVSQSFNDDTWPEVVDNSVTIKAWGAGGAGGYWNGGTAGNGGAGGFAKGTIELTPGTSIYIVVGAGGTVEGNTLTPSVGGNGGYGSGTSSHKGGSGGGFAGVFLGSTASDVTQTNALLIAGGGGGGGSYDRDGEDESGGGGGGSSGAAGLNSPNAGGGGTQSAGGTAGSGATAGGALQGGASQGNFGMYAGGGGGGYWGGGGGSVSGTNGAEETGVGGGGSGFVKGTMTSTVNLAGNNGTAGSATGYQATVNASADDLGSLDNGKGGGFNSPGYKGYVSITDGVGTRTFDTSQAITIRDANVTTVTAEVFGAGGGEGSGTSGDGGDGGIVKASKSLAYGTVLKIVVGNGGTGYAPSLTGALEGNTSDPMRGGYIYSDETNQTGGQGGSGSGVFVTSVSHGNSQVVAGGGGGGAGNNNAAGGDSHTGNGATDSLNGSDGGGNAVYKGIGADGASGGAASGIGGGAGAAFIGGYSGTVASTNGGDYSSGGSGGGGYYGGGGANHGGSAGEQAGGGAGSGYVESSWTRLAATGMTPKAGATNDGTDGTDGEVKITDGAGTTTYSTPGTFDHTVS